MSALWRTAQGDYLQGDSAGLFKLQKVEDSEGHTEAQCESITEEEKKRTKDQVQLDRTQTQTEHSQLQVDTSKERQTMRDD